MPADLEACVRQMEGKPEIDDPWAFCNWAKKEGKGPFAGAEAIDLDAAVREFRDGAGPLIEPPVVIGHEEHQPLLDNTGIPAVGYVVGLRRRGAKLYADLSQIFPSVARLIEAGAYKHVSAEIYPRDNPPEGIHADGCVFRRLALLGGELPHVKSLSDLPPPGPERVIPDVEVFEAGDWQGERYTVADLDDIVRNFNRLSRPARRFAEYVRLGAPRVHLHRTRRVWQTNSRTWACFSEVAKMADSALHDAAVSAVKAMHPDLPDAFLAELTDEQLAMLAAPPAETGESGEGSQQMQDTPDRATMITDLVALGEDPAALEAMADADLQALWMEKKGTMQMAETQTTSGQDSREQQPAPARQPAKITTTQHFSEADLERVVAKVAEKVMAPLRREIQGERQVRQHAEREARHGLIRTFCERMVKEGRLRPADVEFAKDGRAVGPVAKALLAADAVRKFSDGKTALELQMEAMESLPARKFGEQVQDPVKQSGGAIDPARRDHLLGLTPRGRSVLAKEEGKKQDARVFAETLASVLKPHLNGGS